MPGTAFFNFMKNQKTTNTISDVKLRK